MNDFDYRKMSRLTFPTGVNETEYLRVEENGTWTASDKEQIVVLANTNPAYAVAVLNAKMHPVSGDDREHMIITLQKWIQRYQEDLEHYGTLSKWKSEVKDVHRGIERMAKEIKRLRELTFPG